MRNSDCTGDLVYSFGYDDAGRLTTVTDNFLNVTTIAYAESGEPESITSPFGVATELDTDGAYLTRIANAAGEDATMTYGRGGLLETFTTAAGTSTFTYDPDIGLLVTDESPDGATLTLNRIERPRGHTVTATTEMGRQTSYAYEQANDGAVVRTVTQPGGAVGPRPLKARCGKG